MAKNNYNSLSLLADDKEFVALERQMQERRRQIAVQCSHVHPNNGKPAIKMLNNKYDSECTICGKRFNMDTVPSADLLSATKTVVDAIEQMRFMSNRDSDMDLIVHLGNLGFNITEVAPTYDQLVQQYSQGGNKKRRKGKKNNNNQSQYGSFGSASSLSFIGGGGRSGGNGNKKKSW